MNKTQTESVKQTSQTSKQINRAKTKKEIEMTQLGKQNLSQSNLLNPKTNKRRLEKKNSKQRIMQKLQRDDQNSDEKKQLMDDINQKLAIEMKVKRWEQKQKKKQLKSTILENKIEKELREGRCLKRIYNCLVCKKTQKNVDDSNDSMQKDEIKKQNRQREVTQLMQMMSQEQMNIQKASDRWKYIRKMIKVIKMIPHLGEKRIQALFEQKMKNQIQENEESESMFSKLIIHPGNYWLLHINNFIQFIFIIYIFLLPLIVSFDYTMARDHINILLVFDIIFVADRLIDLFVGFYNSNGRIETSMTEVIKQNISTKVFIELIVSFGPFYLDLKDVDTFIYIAFKIPRYTRLFEMDGQIQDILDYYSQILTVFEIKKIEKTLNLMQFVLSTLINLHILTCIQIGLCRHRTFADSWMGTKGVDAEDFRDQYIYALYFVTTTLSTCGFGDIAATPGDATESGVILFLQFVGMLFYSMTIQKVQSFMISDENPVDYANNMSDLVENLIVKVGQMPSTEKIKSESIKNWKEYTQAYFLSSPNAFLQENQFYNSMSENMKVQVVKNNLLTSFVERFDILFQDPDHGYKADDKLITQIVSSLTLEHNINIHDSVIPLGIVSQSIYCIYQGSIDIYYKDLPYILCSLDEGSYFGDISCMFKVKNQYSFIRSDIINPHNSKLFFLQENYLNNILEKFPQFGNLLKIRALRRQHYFRKLRHQQSKLMNLKNKSTKSQDSSLQKELLQMKLARLVEENMSYEDLASKNNFSEDEITFTYEQNLRDEQYQKIKESLAYSKSLDKQIKSLKQFSIESMQLILNTIASIDENSKKIAFKHFDQNNVNLLSKYSPMLIQKLQSFQAGLRDVSR